MSCGVFGRTLLAARLRKHVRKAGSRAKGAASRESTVLTSARNTSVGLGANEASPCREFIRHCGSVGEHRGQQKQHSTVTGHEPMLTILSKWQYSHAEYKMRPFFFSYFPKLNADAIERSEKT